MHITVKNLLDIENNIKVHLKELNINHYPKIIAVSKTFKIEKNYAPHRKWSYTFWGK